MEGAGEGGGEEGAGKEGELIQRFTYTRTCVSHVIGGSAAIYKVEEKYSFDLRAGLKKGNDENSMSVVCCECSATR